VQESKGIYDKLRTILTGQESVKLYVEFLKRNNKVDMLILKSTKVGSCNGSKQYTD
jgi:26S proteasome regulatory subunit N2